MCPMEVRTIGNEGVKRDQERETDREMGGSGQRETATSLEKIAKKRKSSRRSLSLKGRHGVLLSYTQV